MSLFRSNDFLPIESRKRLAYIFLCVMLLFSVLLLRFYCLQILEEEYWKRKARIQHQLLLKEPCRRGSLYANTEMRAFHKEPLVALAIDIPCFHLYVDTTLLSQEQKTMIAHKIAKERRVEELMGVLMMKSRGRKLLSWLSLEEKREIESWWLLYAKEQKLAKNVLFFVQDFQRSYPYGKMLGQILHTVRDDRDPKTHAPIPTGGLELTLHAYLQGKEGKRLLLRSPKNALETGTVLAEPKHGTHVMLTINPYLQAVAEEEIAHAVLTAKAKSGWAIMMDPYTGELFAWAQYPWFTPSCYRAFFNDPMLQQEAKCKGITDPFEPGSTFKPFTVLLCFKANEELQRRGESLLFSPEEKIATGQGIFPGRSTPIRDTKKHHYLNMDMALQKSSNIYMARMVQRIIERLGQTWYRNALAELGFGTKTGVELPSESAGLLPVPGKVLAHGALEWSKATPYSLAFGHNLLVNSLQMVRAYALLANGGYLVQPTLIKKQFEIDEQGKMKVVWEQTFKRTKEPFLREASLQRLIRGMYYVTKQGGSAPKGDIPNYTEIGKTGTSEKIEHGHYSKSKHISSFVGFAPATHPRFVLLIVIDEPEAGFIPGVGKMQYGGNCAAPAFRAIGAKTLEYLGETPDDPHHTHFVQEAKELGELYKQWNH